MVGVGGRSLQCLEVWPIARSSLAMMGWGCEWGPDHSLERLILTELLTAKYTPGK